MKNSKITMAALIALFMLSYASAQKILVDFDGKGPRTGSIIKSVKANIDNAGAFDVPFPKSEPEILVNVGETELKKNLDYSIKTAIEYCKKRNFSILENNFRKLLVYGTPEEKYQSIYNHKIPDRISLMKELAESRGNFQYDLTGMIKETKGANPVCMEWDTQEVCIDKDKCDNVCDASTLVCLVLGAKGECAVWGPACHIVCRIIKDCHQWPVCVQWYTDIY